ncbi:MAG: hypothetical protein LBN08_01050 [Lactobacillales bacterium]|jgi:hypothetical protein|nr:hypothetical protein [Lactobacillales bacterium]
MIFNIPHIPTLMGLADQIGKGDYPDVKISEIKFVEDEKVFVDIESYNKASERKGNVEIASDVQVSIPKTIEYFSQIDAGKYPLLDIKELKIAGDYIHLKAVVKFK